MTTFADFCHWLPSHANLVSEIVCDAIQYAHDEPEVMHSLQAFAFMAMGHMQTANAEHHPAPQLRDLTIDIISAPAATNTMRGLQHCPGLTKLVLNMAGDKFAPTFSAAAAVLTSLRALHILPPEYVQHTLQVFPQSFIRSISVMQLTELVTQVSMRIDHIRAPLRTFGTSLNRLCIVVEQALEPNWSPLGLDLPYLDLRPLHHLHTISIDSKGAQLPCYLPDSTTRVHF